MDLLVGGHHLKLTKVTKSTKRDKKWDAHFVIDDLHTQVVSFGDVNENDFTQHQNEQLKQLFLNRRVGKVSNPMTEDALVRWVLWNKPEFRKGVEDFKRRFHV